MYIYIYHTPENVDFRLFIYANVRVMLCVEVAVATTRIYLSIYRNGEAMCMCVCE